MKVPGFFDWLYERLYWAHLGDGFVAVPDQVAADRKAFVGVEFPAMRGDKSLVLVKIDAEATTGTGDLVVTDSRKG